MSSLVESKYLQDETRISGPGWQETWHYQGGQHWKYSDLRKRAAWADRDLSEYMAIAFARNPYSWVLSVWNNFYKESINPASDVFAALFPDRSFESFCKFIENRVQERKLQAWGTTTQSSFIKDRDVKNPFIGKFENLEEDIRSLLQRFDLAVTEIPHEIKDNPDARKNALEYYSTESVEIVNRVFSEDFTNFSYETV